MQININVADKKFVKATDNTLVIARFPNSPELLGVCLEFDTADHVRFPSFHVEASNFTMPVITMFAEGATSFEPLNLTASQWLDAQPDRQELAGFFVGFCERMGLVQNHYAMINAVYWLEETGFKVITDDNAQKATETCRDVYEMVISYCETYALTEEELAA